MPALDKQHLESLANLGDYLNVYQIHSATLESGVLENSRVLDRLAEIRDSGTTIGLSTSGPNQAEVIRKATAIERGGRRVFGTVQSTWNLLEQSAGPALAAARDAGMGVLIKESMANGRLTTRDPVSTAPLVHSYPGETPDVLAIAAVLAQPWVDAVISGASTPEQLASNLRALDLNFDEINGLPSIVEEPGSYWATRSGLAWT